MTSYIPQRSNELEYLDLGSAHYTAEEYHHCLYQLGRIGKYLGNNRALLHLLRFMQQPAQSLLDVGCGSGSFALACSIQFPHMQVVGIDLSKEAIAYANLQKKQAVHCPHVTYRTHDTDMPFAMEKSVDVVTASLVCHHMKDAEIVAFIHEARKVARKKVFISDLHRHAMARALFSSVAPLFFRNRLIIHDGIISIQRAFVKKDWQYYLLQAGVEQDQYKICWSFPFRWIVTIEPSDA